MKIKDKIKEKKNNKNNKIDKKMSIKSINKKYLKNGSYSIMISAIFIIIIIVINLIIGELPAKYTQVDISGEQLYSIGDETKAVLDGLDKDVTIYQIAQSGSEDETISNLLRKYEDESKHIEVVTKDPVVNPKFVTEYTSEDISMNSLIVVCGERNKVVDYNNMYETSMDYYSYSYNTTGFDGEGQITSAISYVTSENLPVLYTLEGHGEKTLDTVIQEDIEKANIEIKSLNLLTEGSVPEDADCLLINSLTSDVSEDEKDAILEYLENGGKAMIFSDYSEQSMENFDAILENYGVKRAEGIVFENDSQHYAMQMPYYLIPDINSTDATADVASSGYYVLAPYAQGIQKLENVRDTLTITSLLTTSDSAYSKTNLASDTLEKESGDIDGPFDLGVSITETLDDGKETQIVYYSTANILDSQVNQMVSGGNEKLVMSSLSWMCSSDETTTVSIPSKSLEVSYLTLTAYDTSFWTICTIGLIPGFFLVAGFVVWFKRRRA
ncbi:MAG: GldG family protein [Eubacteriales bacterium]|nr:GldG family protein [Eubacteriales bacterium]